MRNTDRVASTWRMPVPGAPNRAVAGRRTRSNVTSPSTWGAMISGDGSMDTPGASAGTSTSENRSPSRAMVV